MGCLGLYNGPKADVHPGHKLKGPKEEEKEEAKVCIMGKTDFVR
jgi:hypothetical protein